MDFDFDLKQSIPKPIRGDYGIGAVGAGFIMRDVQLKTYLDAGFRVAGITSRTPEIAREVLAEYINAFGTQMKLQAVRKVSQPAIRRTHDATQKQKGKR